MSQIENKIRVLVLGGATSMLGQDIVPACQDKGWEVFSLGRQDGPITETDFLEKKLAQINPDYIFNCIAYTAVDQAEDEPLQAMTINAQFPAFLNRLVQGSSAHLIQYSTDFIFDGENDIAYKEDDEPNPKSVYGSTKLAGERAIECFDSSTIIRTAWLYGAGGKNFVRTILGIAQKRPQISVVHDQTGSPTYTKDLAQMSVLLAEKKCTGIYNAVNVGQASWCDLACEAINILGLNTVVLPITSAQWPQKAKRPPFSVLDTSKLQESIDYVPRTWTQALQEYVLNNFSAIA